MIQEGSKYIIFAILKKMENSNFSPKFYCWTPLRGYQVPRIVVQLLVQELDPEGCEMRRQHKLKRRVY